MNRLDEMFKDCKKKKRKALIAFVTAGFPDLKATESIIKTLINAGVDAVEIGVPFSDPIADGPTIQYASQKALEKGLHLARILTWTKKLRKHVSAPLLFMGYWNPFYQFGIDRFLKKAGNTLDGIIIPDLSYEESRPYQRIFKKNNLRLIQLITPVSSDERIEKILQAGEGFLYAVSTTGVTGARKNIPSQTMVFLKKLRSRTTKPIAVGIGISHPQQIQKVKSFVNGIIVGSAYIKIIRDYTGTERLKKIRQYTGVLRAALDN